jgi:DNA-binding LacI/PurR family transcriptional regulator
VIDNPLPSDKCKNKGWADAARHYRLSSEYCIPWDVRKNRTSSSRNGSHDRSDFIYQPESHTIMTEVVGRLTSFPERITALICSSDEVAIGLQSYLQAQGWHLPRDLSIVGYDGISLGEYVYPSLTTIAPDYSRMAEVAVNRLLELIARHPGESPNRHEEMFVEPNLILRGSTAPQSPSTTGSRARR